MSRNGVLAQPRSIADLLKDLGDISPDRVRLRPQPGKAMEKDVTFLHRKEKRLCELVDGVLVEKIMGAPEAALAIDIIVFLSTYLARHDIGMLLGPDGMLRLMPGLVRIPDVSFLSWHRLPGKQRPTEALPDLVPDLAVEVLSTGNTKAEMKRKVREYLDAGCRIIWLVDPRKRIVEVITVAGRRSSTRWARSTVATCYRALNSESATSSPK